MSRVNYYQSAFNSQIWIFILPKFMHFGDSRRPFVIDNRLGKLGDAVAISNLTLSMTDPLTAIASGLGWVGGDYGLWINDPL